MGTSYATHAVSSAKGRRLIYPQDRPWSPNSRGPLHGAINCRTGKSDGLDCGSISMAVKHHNGAYELDMHNLFGHYEVGHSILTSAPCAR